MAIVCVEVSDVILKSHRQNIETIKDGLQHGLVIWEY